MSWFTALVEAAPVAVRLARGVLTLVEGEFPSLKGMEVATAGLNLASAGTDALAASGSPASVGAVAAAVAAVASAAGLSSEDKANTAGLATAAQMVAPILAGVAGAVEPKHLDVINAVLANAMAIGNGLSSGFAPAVETAPAA